MKARNSHEFRQIPGLYRCWDVQFVLNRYDDFQLHYVEQTEDGVPLFAVYRRGTDDAPQARGAA